MKKFIIVVMLVAVMLFSLTACGKTKVESAVKKVTNEPDEEITFQLDMTSYHKVVLFGDEVGR